MRDGACVWLDEGEAIYGGWKLPETAAEEGEGEAPFVPRQRSFRWCP